MFFILLCYVSSLPIDFKVHDFIAQFGLPYEEHLAATADGAQLMMQRIPRAGAPPMLLVHGLLDTAATWVLNDRDESLAFIAYDAGYDVWLFNARGNTYSPAPPSYAFDWDQHAQYDVPAALHLVYAATATPVVVVAHSQGATTVLAHLSTSPTDASMVRFFGALAPVAMMHAQRSVLLKWMAKLHVDAALKLAGDGPFSLTPGVLAHYLGAACGVVPSLCHDAASSLFGAPVDCNATRLPVYAAHWPDRTSVRNMRHWLQNARSGQFAAMSGALYAPPPSLAVPWALFGGRADLLADVNDLAQLAAAWKRTSSNKLVYVNLSLPYSHMGFTWSYSAQATVYAPLLALIKKF